MPSKPTESKQRPSGLIPFKPGQSGNPNGRPKGSRNKLGEQFVADIYADWQKHGIATIQQVREEKPDAYLKVVASLLPKELNVRVSDLEDLPEDELDRSIHELAQKVGPALGLVPQGGVRGTPGRKAKAH